MDDLDQPHLFGMCSFQSKGMGEGIITDFRTPTREVSCIRFWFWLMHSRAYAPKSMLQKYPSQLVFVFVFVLAGPMIRPALSVNYIYVLHLLANWYRHSLCTVSYLNMGSRYSISVTEQKHSIRDFRFLFPLVIIFLPDRKIPWATPQVTNISDKFSTYNTWGKHAPLFKCA